MLTKFNENFNKGHSRLSGVIWPYSIGHLEVPL